MGNGVGVLYSEAACELDSEYVDKFSKLEKKVKSGHFERSLNENEYKMLTTNAIKKQQLDVLELLVKGGDIKSLNPLHTAALFSSFESMELLLSAGLSPLELNLEGKTPLHFGAAAHDDAAVLCSYLLLMHGEKALKKRDKNGDTPLHIAVRSNNAVIVQNMLDFGASLAVTNNAGQSPRQIAKSMKHDEVLEIIDERRTGKLRKKKDKFDQSKMSKQQHERIMKVWEKFFENALMGVDFDLVDDSNGIGEKDSISNRPYNEYESIHKPQNELADILFKEDRIAQKSLYPSECKDYDYNYKCSDSVKVSYHYEEGTKSYVEILENEPVNFADDEKGRVFRCASEWFSWILSYEYDSERRLALALSTGGDGTDGYFVANCFSLDHNFELLDEHLGRLDRYGLWQGYDVANQASNADEHYGSGGYSETQNTYLYYFPGCIKSAITAGWINFYDSVSNTCVWMHIPSGSTEPLLPLGCDDLSWELGLEQCVPDDGFEGDFDSDYWLKPPQFVARSWVMVSIPSTDGKVADRKYDDDGETVWYFSNRVTGHSTWEQPPGWENLVAQAAGWILCAEEDKPADLYW